MVNSTNAIIDGVKVLIRKFHGRELIVGISKNNDTNQFYVEIYNLKNRNMTKYLTSDTFGNIFME